MTVFENVLERLKGRLGRDLGEDPVELGKILDGSSNKSGLEMQKHTHEGVAGSLFQTVVTLAPFQFANDVKGVEVDPFDQIDDGGALFVLDNGFNQTRDKLF